MNYFSTQIIKKRIFELYVRCIIVGGVTFLLIKCENERKLSSLFYLLSVINHNLNEMVNGHFIQRNDS